MLLEFHFFVNAHTAEIRIEFLVFGFLEYKFAAIATRVDIALKKFKLFILFTISPPLEYENSDLTINLLDRDTRRTHIDSRILYTSKKP